MIYVCQNNLWAESVPLRLQTALKNLADRAKVYGFPGVVLDGNDVIRSVRRGDEGNCAGAAGEGRRCSSARPTAGTGTRKSTQQSTA